MRSSLKACRYSARYQSTSVKALPLTFFQTRASKTSLSRAQLDTVLRQKRKTGSKRKEGEDTKGKLWWKKSSKTSRKIIKPEVIQAAVKDQNIQVLRQCLDLSEELKQRRENMLMLACMYKGKKLLDTLLAQGEDPNYTNAQGCTPLHYCCVTDFSRGAITLLDNGASIHAQDELGLTPLHQAALSNSVKCVSVLLAYGADASRRDNDDDQPLHTAARVGSYEAAILLLDHGVDVNAKNTNGETALHCAAEDGKSKIVELLIERGALLNLLDKEGHSALHRASKNEEDSDCVIRLVKAGAEVNDTLSLGISPLHLAAYGGNIEAVDALVKGGAAIDYKGAEGWTPLMLAAQEGHIGVMSYLLREGAKVNIRNDEGLAALHLAVPHPSATQALIFAGADVNVKDNNRLTPLHLAAQSPDDRDDVVLMLLEAGADVDSATPDEGFTALHLAAASHNPKIVATLLEQEADIDALSSLGETALHYAVETQDVEFVKALCKAGAAVNVRGRRGTPLQLAEKQKDYDIAQVLTQYLKIEKHKNE